MNIFILIFLETILSANKRIGGALKNKLMNLENHFQNKNPNQPPTNPTHTPTPAPTPTPPPSPTPTPTPTTPTPTPALNQSSSDPTSPAPTPTPTPNQPSSDPTSPAPTTATFSNTPTPTPNQPSSTPASPAPTTPSATSKTSPVKQVLLFLSETKPKIYFSRTAQNEFVFYDEDLHPPSKAGGSYVTFTPSDLVHKGYKMFMDGIAICSDKSTSSLKPCDSNVDHLAGVVEAKKDPKLSGSDPVNSIWFFAKKNGSYHISQGDLCVTRNGDDTSVAGQWPIILDTCDSRMNQYFSSTTASSDNNPLK